MSKPSEAMERERVVRISAAGFSDRLRQLRQEKGLSQRALAEKVGIDKSHVAKLETGDRTAHGVSIGTVEALASALGTTTQYLRYGEEQPGRGETDLPKARLIELLDALRDQLRKTGWTVSAKHPEDKDLAEAKVEFTDSHRLLDAAAERLDDARRALFDPKQPHLPDVVAARGFIAESNKLALDAVAARETSLALLRKSVSRKSPKR